MDQNFEAICQIKHNDFQQNSANEIIQKLIGFSDQLASIEMTELTISNPYEKFYDTYIRHCQQQDKSMLEMKSSLYISMASQSNLNQTSLIKQLKSLINSDKVSKYYINIALSQLKDDNLREQLLSKISPTNEPSGPLLMKMQLV